MTITSLFRRRPPDVPPPPASLPAKAYVAGGVGHRYVGLSYTACHEPTSGGHLRGDYVARGEWWRHIDAYCPRCFPARPRTCGVCGELTLDPDDRHDHYAIADDARLNRLADI